MADIFFLDFGRFHSQSDEACSFFWKSKWRDLEKAPDVCLIREEMIWKWFWTSESPLEWSDFQSAFNKEIDPPGSIFFTINSQKIKKKKMGTPQRAQNYLKMTNSAEISADRGVLRRNQRCYTQSQMWNWETLGGSLIPIIIFPMAFEKKFSQILKIGHFLENPRNWWTPGGKYFGSMFFAPDLCVIPQELVRKPFDLSKINFCVKALK